jgi:hypothetical protein
MAEADFFGLTELKEWILQKKYMEAVKTGLKMEIHPGQLNLLDKTRSNHAWLHSLPPKRTYSYDNLEYQDSAHKNWVHTTTIHKTKTWSWFRASKLQYLVAATSYVS